MLPFVFFIGGCYLTFCGGLALIGAYERWLWRRDQRRLERAFAEREQLEYAYLLPSYRRDKEFS